MPELLAADDGLELEFALDELPFDPVLTPAGLELLLDAEPLVDEGLELPVGGAPELPLDKEVALLAGATALSVEPPELAANPPVPEPAVPPPVVEETPADGPTDPEFEAGEPAAGPACGAGELPLPHAGATDMPTMTTRRA